MVLKLEGGVGSQTLPLLITEMTFKAEVKDWSTKVSIQIIHFLENKKCVFNHLHEVITMTIFLQYFVHNPLTTTSNN